MTGRTKWSDVRQKVRSASARERQNQRADAKAAAAIEAAGWTWKQDGPRFVGTKRVIEDDHSITWKFESTYTLEGLARAVARRERES